MLLDIAQRLDLPLPGRTPQEIFLAMAKTVAAFEGLSYETIGSQGISDTPMMPDLLIKLTLVGIVFFGVLNLAGLHTWIERKQSAIMQDRIGANRASIYGFR